LPAVSTGASARLSGPPGGSATRRPGGPASSGPAHVVAGHEKGQPAPGCPHPHSTTMTPAHPPTLTRNVA
jgi:hypothetical protein